MKSEYPFHPVTYQDSEPADYLKTYSGIRQVSIEKARILKIECLGQQCEDDEEQPVLNKEEDGG